MWNAATGEPIHEGRLILDPATGPYYEKDLRIPEHYKKGLLSCALSPDDRLIACGGGEKTVILWDLTTHEIIAELAGHSSDVTACVFTPDGSKVLSASLDRTLRLWDLATRKTIHELTGHTDCIFTCDISPDGTFAVSAGEDQTVRVWDHEIGEERLTLEGHTDEIWGCVISPDGQYVLSASWDNTIRAWSAISGKELAALVLPSMLQCIATFPGGDRIVAGDTAGAIHLIELMGLSLGAPIVTAVRRDSQVHVRCPSCSRIFELRQDQLGKEITCPDINCKSRIRLNTFVADSALLSMDNEDR